jgi:hypothetical protein
MEVRKLALEYGRSLKTVVERWRAIKPWKGVQKPPPFTHLRITHGAFPYGTQHELEQYLVATEAEEETAARLLRFAAMCILEEISYTRKDGQYLRWDYRSDRRQGQRPFDKGYIPSFEEAIAQKLDTIHADLSATGYLPGLFEVADKKGQIEIIQGSSLLALPEQEAASFDGLITSPPYVNRYDYTRTYALELALLGMNEAKIKALRQEMISCTVENREKEGLEKMFISDIYERACETFEDQSQLHAILDYLEYQKETKQLNNAGIPRMIRNYFFEMALIIFESARVLKPGARFIMVNDNVRYNGAIIPVDLILSDFAEQAGFEVEAIWVLPTGKGNSSQQMGMHGREELRKCIYIWRR